MMQQTCTTEINDQKQRLLFDQMQTIPDSLSKIKLKKQYINHYLLLLKRIKKLHIFIDFNMQFTWPQKGKYLQDKLVRFVSDFVYQMLKIIAFVTKYILTDQQPDDMYLFVRYPQQFIIITIQIIEICILKILSSKLEIYSISNSLDQFRLQYVILYHYNLQVMKIQFYLIKNV